MRQIDFVAVDTVVAHKQPTGEPLIDLMNGIGERREGGLHRLSLYEFQQQSIKVRVGFNDLLKLRRVNTMTRAADLHKAIKGRFVRSQKEAGRRKPVAPKEPALRQLILR